jgi:6-pyruvoyltetrahydropterin/6-carboxytetrahydropterin synthase
MQIRKLFKFEGAHIVRNCTSERCKYNIHGHSYKVEVFFTSSGFDNSYMVMDFGLMKGTIKDLIDSFDHAYSYWDKESAEFVKFIHENSARWISMPVSPSAESYSLMLFYVIDRMVKATQFNNGERGVELKSVRVHETDTGYAESFRSDLEYWNYGLKDIVFSEQIKAEWHDSEMYDKLIGFHEGSIEDKPFINPSVSQQV